MQCLPDNLRDRVYYQPTNEGIEKRIRERMDEIKRLHSRAQQQAPVSKRKNLSNPVTHLDNLSGEVWWPCHVYTS